MPNRRQFSPQTWATHAVNSTAPSPAAIERWGSNFFREAIVAGAGGATTSEITAHTQPTSALSSPGPLPPSALPHLDFSGLYD